jgi:hypothetical protein
MMKNLEQTDDTTTTSYQQIIRSLMYLATGTRPDVAYTITHLSQFNTNPSTTYMATAKRVLRYLQATKDVALFYPWKSSLKLMTYSDAAYGNDIDSRRSFTGYNFQL